MFIDDLGRDSATAVFFGLTILYYTASGVSYTLADVSQWCQGAGFEPLETRAMTDYTLVFARKPA
jgi:hypothetical protein